MQPELNESVMVEVKKVHPIFTITPLSKYLALGLFVVLPFVGGGVGYMLAPIKVVEVPKIIEVPVASTEDVEISDIEWTTPEYATRFSVNYPKGWGIVNKGNTIFGYYQFDPTVGTDPLTGTGDSEHYIWSVHLYEYSEQIKNRALQSGEDLRYSVESLTRTIGTHFAERQISKEQILLNGMPATKVVVTSGINPHLQETAIMVDGSVRNRPDLFFVISDHGNSAHFETFYSSFQVLEPAAWEIEEQKRTSSR